MRLFPLLTFMLLSCSITSLHAQANHYTFEQADSLIQMEDRPMVIFLHTDWCKYCLAMKQSTLKDESIITYLNEYFYFVSFNAESEYPIKFRGRDFQFLPNGSKTGVHELAMELGSVEGELNYPATIVLNSNNEILFQAHSFMNAEELMLILQAIPK